MVKCFKMVCTPRNTIGTHRADKKAVINSCKKKDGILTENGIYLWPSLKNGFEITKG
jgi:hypothetical protein